MFTRFRLAPPQVVTAESVLAAINKFLLDLEQKGAIYDDYKSDFKTSVTDGSGAALGLTINVAKYVLSPGGRMFTIHLDVTYPATASGAAAQLSGMPFIEANHAIGALYNNGAGGGTVAQMTGAVVNFYTNAGVAITNANLSGATIRTTLVGMV